MITTAVKFTNMLRVLEDGNSFTRNSLAECIGEFKDEFVAQYDIHPNNNNGFFTMVFVDQSALTLELHATPNDSHEDHRVSIFITDPESVQEIFIEQIAKACEGREAEVINMFKEKGDAAAVAKLIKDIASVDSVMKATAKAVTEKTFDKSNYN